MVSAAVDQRSRIPARFAVAGVQTLATAALRRCALTSEELAADLKTVPAVLRDKLEFEAGEVLDALPELPSCMRSPPG